jgi:protein-tyrosine-phosphatase
LALGLCLLALGLALLDDGGTAMTPAAWLNVSAYLGGYALRFWIMGVLAKSHDRHANLRYFTEEQLVATPILLLALALVAALGGDAVAPLRAGFSILPRPVLLGALAIGGFYALLSLFGTLIYLDRNENTYAVPVNRSASLIAGTVASYGLSLAFDLAPPPAWQIVGVVLLLLAALVLAMGPQLAPRLQSERWIVFVCSGNTCRSAMAERLAMLEASRRLGIAVDALADSGLRFVSAGLTARVGQDLDGPARVALSRIGAPIAEHRAQPVTVELLARAEVVICLTPAQREAVVAMAPRLAARVHVLVPGEAIELPEDGDYDRYAARLLALVMACFDRLDLVRPQRASPA